ncbi:MAG: PilZ domain-containing protein [Desulfobacterales bacterium]|nr:PilZ domain-containing protein [Desulfobacterales bacterium]
MNSKAHDIAVPTARPVPAGRAANPNRDGDGAPRILLIVQQGAARDRYRREILETGACIDTAASIEEFQGALTQSAYNGIVIDIPTKIQAMNRHKALVHSILERFPVIQVNQEKGSGRVRALLHGRNSRQGELQALIREACLSRPPRRLRARQRHAIHFNLLLMRERHPEADGIERSVTINISPDGCFLYTTGRFREGLRVWIRILEFRDQTPIACEVIHHRPWGDTMTIPGIGVCFQSITDAQAYALTGHCPPPFNAERTAGQP